MWHVTCDRWHMTHDTGHMTHEIWHMTQCVGWTFSQNVNSLALAGWDLLFLKIWRKSVTYLINESISNRSVSRTALATVGLLKSSFHWNLFFFLFWAFCGVGWLSGKGGGVGGRRAGWRVWGGLDLAHHAYWSAKCGYHSTTTLILKLFFL